MRLSRNEFGDIVADVLKNIPARFASYLKNLSVDIEPQPDVETCRDLEIDDPADLMGLYQGVPLTEQSVADGVRLPDRIVIYQRSIESAAETREAIVEEIRKTILHEIGHHFGLGEDMLDELGYG